MQSKNNQ